MSVILFWLSYPYLNVFFFLCNKFSFKITPRTYTLKVYRFRPDCSKTISKTLTKAKRNDLNTFNNLNQNASLGFSSETKKTIEGKSLTFIVAQNSNYREYALRLQRERTVSRGTGYETRQGSKAITKEVQFMLNTLRPSIIFRFFLSYCRAEYCKVTFLLVCCSDKVQKLLWLCTVKAEKR